MPFLLLIYQMVNKLILTKNLAKTAKIKIQNNVPTPITLLSFAQ
ncbi:hypothetical protein FORC065_1989 [Yersinia enterocolitica]|nr:hypothetical protein FORC065_1989 [Yersinia enterocolitica]